MSVSFPVIRKQKVESKSPGARKPSRNKKNQRFKVAAYITALICLAAALYFSNIVPSRFARLKVLANIENAELLGVCNTGFVIDNQEHTLFLDVNGLTSPIPGCFEYFLVAGTSIVGMDPPMMSLITADEFELVHVTVRLAPTERPIPMTGGDIVVTQMPKSSIRFGETWVLRAFSQEGAVLWKQAISYVPFIAACSNERLIIGAIDISGGGTPWIICLSKHTGQKLWQQPLNSGVWRSLTFCSDGRISAVLDCALYSLTSQGNILWVYRPGSKIVSAVSNCNISAIATVTKLPDSVSHVLGTTRITVVGADGNTQWSKILRDSLPRLFIYENHLIVLESANASCFRLHDGHKLISVKIDGYPITCVKDVILIYKDRSLTLVDPGIFESIR